MESLLILLRRFITVRSRNLSTQKEKTMATRLEDVTGLHDLELIKKACYFSMKAHKSSEKFLVEKLKFNGHRVFTFPGFWSVDDWLAGESFGETRITATFPSLRSIGLDETAKANSAFLQKFESIRVALQKEVDKAMKKDEPIVFTGHSSGGAIATLATLWFLEKIRKSEYRGSPPLCLTFGSPLIGDRIFPHALNREKWSSYFIHFVMKYDIIPRIFLTPFSLPDKSQLQTILQVFNPRITKRERDSIVGSPDARNLFFSVLKNASLAASHAACSYMGCTNMLHETLNAFVEISPYRPFGTHVFCTGDRELVVVENPEAVLQILFYSLQLSEPSNENEVAKKSFEQHLAYESELKDSFKMQSVVHLKKVEEVSLTLDSGEEAPVLNHLGLSTRARLCVHAAGEFQKKKLENQSKVEDNTDKIEKGLEKAEEYQKAKRDSGLGYYDAFKLQDLPEDFHANVNRLELAGHWDELTEMLKRYELPDEFECLEKWIKLGTRFRRLIEPLDIANYYRHAKNEDAGTYMTKGRPRRYKFTQKWLEHDEGREAGSNGESCVWARVEELKANYQGMIEDVKKNNGVKNEAAKKKEENVKKGIKELEEDVPKWVANKVLSKDLFLKESTFVKLWKTLPREYKSPSLSGFVPESA